MFFFSDDRARIRRIEQLLHLILTKILTMADELNTLKTEVAENKEVIGSAIALLKGLKQRLDDAIASGDPAELTALSNALDTQSKDLAQAVVENTPSEPPTPEP